MGEATASVTWQELPCAVRDAVERHVGAVAEVEQVEEGSAGDFVAVLRLVDRGRVFVKAVAGVDRRMRWLRNEITGNTVAVGLAPQVLFHADLDAAETGRDWLVVGFEHVPGRSAHLAPGSPDLPLVAAAVEAIAALPAGGMRPLRQRWAPTDWWHRVAALAPDTIVGFDIAEMTRLSELVPALVDGDRLLHTDLHGDQILITPDGSAKVIDWGFPGAGAAWIDTAFVMLRLIEAGHTPDAAETWAYARRTFADVDGSALTAWTAYVAGFWTHLAVTGGPGSPRRAQLARDHLRWRLTRYPVSTSTH
ncbi:phosphotransferase family protein [Actinokineospora sp. 24-640]